MGLVGGTFAVGLAEWRRGVELTRLVITMTADGIFGALRSMNLTVARISALLVVHAQHRTRRTAHPITSAPHMTRIRLPPSSSFSYFSFLVILSDDDDGDDALDVFARSEKGESTRASSTPIGPCISIFQCPPRKNACSHVPH